MKKEKNEKRKLKSSPNFSTLWMPLEAGSFINALLH